MRPRRRIAQPVSAIGTASAITGAARANPTATFATPRMEIMPSATPRKWAPESPMKTRAGGKLKSRNPTQHPASAPLSCTTFSCFCWPAASPDTTSRPNVWRLRGAKTAIVIAKPIHIASPPSIAVGFACAWRPPGSATTWYLRDRTMPKGTAIAVTIKAIRNGHRPGRRCSVRLFSAVSLKKSPLVKRVGDRELPAQLQRPLVDRIQSRRVVDALDHVGDAVRDDDHLRLAHAAGRHQGRAYAHPARVEL